LSTSNYGCVTEATRRCRKMSQSVNMPINMFIFDISHIPTGCIWLRSLLLRVENINLNRASYFIVSVNFFPR